MRTAHSPAALFVCHWKEVDRVDRLLNRQEVASRLGVSVKTVQRLEGSGVLGAVRLGRSVRYREGDIEGLIQGRE
jgi:excisionase family DNA binding protein